MYTVVSGTFFLVLLVSTAQFVHTLAKSRRTDKRVAMIWCDVWWMSVVLYVFVRTSAGSYLTSKNFGVQDEFSFMTSCEVVTLALSMTLCYTAVFPYPFVLRSTLIFMVFQFIGCCVFAYRGVWVCIVRQATQSFVTFCCCWNRRKHEIVERQLWLEVRSASAKESLVRKVRQR